MIFEQMKQKKKSEYTLGELILSYVCGYGFTFIGLAGFVIALILGSILAGSPEYATTWEQAIFIDVILALMGLFGCAVCTYLKMW